MNVQKRTEARRWLIKSQRDLGSACRLLEGDEPFRDTALYHCQQAAEKALKAFLAWHEVEFPRTHDLTELVALCVTLEPAFESRRDPAAELTPYAVQYRYPGELLDPEEGEAEKAVEQARDLVDFVAGLFRG
jgi:HEPN domain-containing protein